MKTIKVEGQPFKVVRATRNALRTPKPVYDGDISFTKKTIRLYRGLSRDELTYVFLHECLHRILQPLGLTDYIEEAVCERVGEGIARLLKDNPDLDLRHPLSEV